MSPSISSHSLARWSRFPALRVRPSIISSSLWRTKKGSPRPAAVYLYWQAARGWPEAYYYKIHDKATIHLVMRLRGGASLPGMMFSDVSDTSEICKVQFSHDAPPGRVASAGTNVECKCECTPHYRVICVKNFCSLELSRATFICPNCKRSDRITPITVGFMSRKYRFHGIKLSGEQYTSGWKDVAEDDCYQLFSPDKQIHWHRLVIESAGLSMCDECTICLEPFRKFNTLGCGHQFHAECIVQWVGPCPSCRFNIHLVSGHGVEQ